jgi:type IV pilus assembly protein PilB
MKNLSDRLVEVLKKSKRISEQDLQKALAEHAKDGAGKLREVIVRLGLISDKELTSILSAELKIPFLNLAKYKISPEIARLIPEKMARKHQIIPISKIGNTLTLAMTDPFNIIAVDDIGILTKSKVDCVLATEKDVLEALDKVYASEAENIHDIVGQLSAESQDLEVVKGQEDSDVTNLGSQSAEAPIVKMVDLILREALKKRASDIHVEPFESRVRVRYRVDGALQEALQIPKKSQNAILTRLKIMARLDITEHRVPQDGRFKIKLQDKEVDFRVSVLPVHFGSKIVMRILDKSAISFGLDSLGFLPETLAAFKGAVAKPFGMILITGPTGSGKSTTLYSILSQLNTPERNIITIEDPIEYQVKGITQIHARAEVGLDFANGLRAILRQSPDVVMVGEIRDSETADIAIKASLTGQIVLSTLHTNDAAGAMTRLIDMKVEPFLIASSVVLVAAQRLCRKVCPHCKEKMDIPAEVFKKLDIDLDRIVPDAKSRVFLKGRGCDKCNNTGYRGRLAVLETLVMDDNIRDLIVKRVSSFDIKEYAMKKGMTTLREDAVKKFCQGITTLDEVVRVTTEDE